MAKIVNTVTVKTTLGHETITKTSTHRTYVLASVAEFADGTQALLSWHMTQEAAAKYAQSAEAGRIAKYAATKRGFDSAHVALLAVVVEAKASKAQEEAPAVVVLPSATNSTPATRQQRECRCGCGEQVASAKSEYRPGHDARHAGIVARDIASSSVQFFERTTADSDLGSEALVRKAHAMAERLILKARAKEAKKSSK